MLLERKKDAVSTGNTARSRPWRSLRGGLEKQRAKAEAADFSAGNAAISVRERGSATLSKSTILCRKKRRILQYIVDKLIHNTINR